MSKDTKDKNEIKLCPYAKKCGEFSRDGDGCEWQNAKGTFCILLFL